MAGAWIVAITMLGSCAAKAPSPHSIAVFVPGVVSGSPSYEQLVAGVRKGIEGSTAKMQVIEAGFNQAEWLDRLGAVAATGRYDLVVTSNPSMPELCAKVARNFPGLRFFVADGWLAGDASIHTVLFNQYEQAWLVGYLAGLLLRDGVKGEGRSHIAGIVVGQTYPALDRLIVPGFRAGLEEADPGASLEQRVVGNWYDAAKAADLARSLFAAGCRIVLPIAGGAGQGVLAAARDAGTKALWFDSSGYDLAPGVVVGSAIARQDQLVASRVAAIVGGKGAPLFGRADIVGSREGLVDFDDSGGAYKSLPPAVRTAFDAILAEFRAGKRAHPIAGL